MIRTQNKIKSALLRTTHHNVRFQIGLTAYNNFKARMQCTTLAVMLNESALEVTTNNTTTLEKEYVTHTWPQQ